MSNINFRSLKKFAAGTTLVLLVAAAICFQQGESVAHNLSTPKAAAYKSANLGDALPGMFGGGFAPNLW
jgi:hypothetical protein